MRCVGSETESKAAVLCITLFKVRKIKHIFLIPVLPQRNRCSARFCYLISWFAIINPFSWIILKNVSN